MPIIYLLLAFTLNGVANIILKVSANRGLDLSVWNPATLVAKNYLFLVEAVTAHGPVSHKRYMELEEILEKCSAARIYVSAFPDFKEFKRYANDIAWETEVWVSEVPEHMIHFNGDKFLGPVKK